MSRPVTVTVCLRLIRLLLVVPRKRRKWQNPASCKAPWPGETSITPAACMHMSSTESASDLHPCTSAEVKVSHIIWLMMLLAIEILIACKHI